jgi:hypothetical protein
VRSVGRFSRLAPAAYAAWMRAWRARRSGQRTFVIAVGGLIIVVIMAVAFVPSRRGQTPNTTRAEVARAVHRALAARNGLASEITVPPPTTVADSGSSPDAPVPASACTSSIGPCVPKDPTACVDVSPTLEIEPMCPPLTTQPGAG